MLGGICNKREKIKSTVPRIPNMNEISIVDEHLKETFIEEITRLVSWVKDLLAFIVVSSVKNHSDMQYCTPIRTIYVIIGLSLESWISGNGRTQKLFTHKGKRSVSTNSCEKLL